MGLLLCVKDETDLLANPTSYSSFLKNIKELINPFIADKKIITGASKYLLNEQVLCKQSVM